MEAIPAAVEQPQQPRWHPEQPHPSPRFKINQIVDVTKRIDESKRAQIVGYEWAPDNSRINGKGWSYLIRFHVRNCRTGQWSFGGESWHATEEELIAWQR